MRILEAQEEGKDRKYCMREFKARDEGNLTEFLNSGSGGW